VPFRRDPRLIKIRHTSSRNGKITDVEADSQNRRKRRIDNWPTGSGVRFAFEGAISEGGSVQVPYPASGMREVVGGLIMIQNSGPG